MINSGAPILVAQINRQHRCANGYASQLPWLLLKTDGKVRRFPTQGEAKDEALKCWPSCSFKRS